MTNVLVLVGHPNPESFNAGLARAYAEGLEAAGVAVQVVELTSLSFDLVLRHGHDRDQALEPDLLALRGAFERARHVAWFFPTYWGAPPAIVRALVDRLFLPGWAFRYEGHALPTGLLRGRSARVVSTMDSPSWWYALAHRWSLQAVMGTATLRFCGFSPVRFSLLHAVRAMTAAKREAWLARMVELGRRDGAEARRADRGRPPALAQRPAGASVLP